MRWPWWDTRPIHLLPRPSNLRVQEWVLKGATGGSLHGYCGSAAVTTERRLGREGRSSSLGEKDRSENYRSHQRMAQDSKRRATLAFDRDYAGVSAAMPRMLCLRRCSLGGRRDVAQPGRPQGSGTHRRGSGLGRPYPAFASVHRGWRSPGSVSRTGVHDPVTAEERNPRAGGHQRLPASRGKLGDVASHERRGFDRRIAARTRYPARARNLRSHP